LEIENGQGIDLGGVLQRYDGNTRIESWVFPVSVRHVAEMYETVGYPTVRAQRPLIPW